MTVNIGSFVFTLAKKIEATTDPLELTILTKAAAKLKGGTINSVSSFSLLPTITSSMYGDLYLVENENIIYWAHPAGWMLLEVTPQVSRLYGWGKNSFRQVGDGTTVYRSSPTLVIGRQGEWRKLGSGLGHSKAIKNDGTLWTWGINNGGNLGTGDTTLRSSPTTTIGGGTTWCDVNDGRGVTTSAIKTDGTLWTWGCNDYGQLGIGTSGAGTNRSSPGTVAGEGTNWCSVKSDDRSNVSLKTDGTLWTWGRGTSGLLGDGTTTHRSSPGTTAGGGTNWCQIGQSLTLFSAIKTDGTLWTWGQNFNGDIGDGTTTARSSPVTVTGGGTTWCFSSGKMGIKTDGTLWIWGSGGSGQIGDGTTVNRSSPVTTAGGGTTWRSGGVGYCMTAGIKTDGTLWTWGLNACGILATSNFISRSSPGTTVGGGTNWFCISLGSGEHALALTCE
jgi:alpha-tubulin suppressor-like RCC1 family protein